MSNRYLEEDCRVIVKDVKADLAPRIGNAVARLVGYRQLCENPLDLRRMHRIIVTTDFAGELTALAKESVSGRPIAFTNEEYAVAVAKVQLLLKNGDYEIVAIINANWLAPLAAKPDDLEPSDCKFEFHLLHHELVHVHDNNQQIDTNPNFLLKHAYSGKSILLGPLLEACWAEYFANYHSSISVPKSYLDRICGSFIEALERTKREVDSEIYRYRTQADLDSLLSFFERHGHWLVRTACYTLGYMDGLELPLHKISPDAAQKLKGSYFERTWTDLQATLRDLFARYPEPSKSNSVYEPLALVIEDYYTDMGFLLRLLDDGSVYVDIPFRPENTPEGRLT